MVVASFLRTEIGDLALWQQWSALVAPILLASLAVMGSRFRRRDPGSRAAVVALDRHRLGDRRYTSNRIWFSAFVSQLAAAEGIETHVDDALDLELVAIQESMIKASAAPVDDDLEALGWLTAHFRRDLLDQESETPEQPGIGSCWLAFGTIERSGVSLRPRSRLDLRIVNAGDLGQQAFVNLEWIDRGRRLRSSSFPVAAVIRERDAALLVERVSNLLRSPAANAGPAAPASLAKRLVTAATDASIEAPLGDAMIGALQAARTNVASAWGDQWWAGTDVGGVEIRTEIAARSQLFSDTRTLARRHARSGDRDQTTALT